MPFNRQRGELTKSGTCSLFNFTSLLFPNPAILFIFAVLCMCSTVSCSSSQPSAQGMSHRGKSGKPPHGSKPTLVQVEPVKRGTISRRYEATGTLAVEREAAIIARISGIIKAIHVEEGDDVKKGTLLLELDNEEYAYKLAQAEANTLDLKSRFQRLEKLKSHKMASVEEFETLENNLRSAMAAEKLARLNLSYTRVTAPFSGRIIARAVAVGQYVNPGSTLFTIADFHPLLLRIYVPAREFSKVDREQAVHIKLDGSKTTLRGKITLISPVIDPDSGTIKITIAIDEYPESVRPGDFARVSLEIDRRVNTLQVPRRAIVPQRGEQILYVVENGKAVARRVKIGFEEEEYTEIIEGVKQGELVVVKGQGLLKPGMPVKIVGSGQKTERPSHTQPSAHKQEG